MSAEQEQCPACGICKRLGNLGYNCANTTPPFSDDGAESIQLKKISFQLQEVKTCLHSIVLLLGEK